MKEAQQGNSKKSMEEVNGNEEVKQRQKSKDLEMILEDKTKMGKPRCERKAESSKEWNKELNMDKMPIEWKNQVLVEKCKTQQIWLLWLFKG